MFYHHAVKFFESAHCDGSVGHSPYQVAEHTMPKFTSWKRSVKYMLILKVLCFCLSTCFRDSEGIQFLTFISIYKT
jgi:hypothetical protein